MLQQQQTNIPGLTAMGIPNYVNGDTVIAFTNQKTMRSNGWFDASKVSTYLADPTGKPHMRSLGLINMMSTTHNQPLPLMHDLFSQSAVLEIEEGESIRYDIPVTKNNDYCMTMEDTSDEHEFPGIDETVFRIVLNRKFGPSEIITYNLKNGEQVMVSPDHTPEMVGENWSHYVMMSSQSKSEYFKKDFLKAGIQYFKVTQVTAEWETKFGEISFDLPPAASLTCEFTLGDPRTVESFMTSKAANMRAPGLANLMSANYDRMMANAEMFGKGNDMFLMSKVTKDGKSLVTDPRTMKIGATLEYLGLQELYKMEAFALSFAQAGTWKSGIQTKFVNEGIWPQLRRGKIIPYASPGGITWNHLKEAAAYIYKNSLIDVKDRMITFRGGYMAMQNIEQLFREAAIFQLNHLPAGMLGTAAQIPAVFSGPLDSLTMERVAIGTVNVPYIGKVKVEHDSSLDFDLYADRNSVGFHGDYGFADSSYSLTIWDATAAGVSNVTSSVKGANLVEGGKSNANIYYIKNADQPSIIYGYEQGRMANKSDFSEIMSSLKVMGKNFWGIGRSAALMLDCSRYITIELERTANK